MLQNIVVGPPLVGATELKPLPDKTVGKDFKGSGSDSSFGKMLDGKMSSSDSKEMKGSPQKELRQSKEKPQNQKAKETDKEVASPKQDGKTGKKGIARQQAIKEFMDSFESEFEIPPTRLVEAMAQLDDAELAQSPEDTADAVIEQLGLDDVEADKARAMYASLLMQLNQMPQPQEKPVPEMAIGAGVSQQNMQERVLAAQDKQSVMSASVDRLNKKFWMGQDAKPDAMTMPSLDEALSQNLMMEEDSLSALPTEDLPVEMETSPVKVSSEGSKSKLPDLAPHLQGQMKETISPTLLAALAAKQAAAQSAEGKGSEEEAPALMEEFQQAVQAPKLEKSQMAMAKQMPVQDKASQEFFQNQNQGQSWMQQQNSKEFMQPKASGEKEVLAKLSEKSTGFKNALTGLEGIQATPIKGEALGMGAATPMAAAAIPTPVNQGENEAAVKQLMNQAQYLIKKGGGEMKVQMTPEGMGTIHLKVMLQDGKVNMQMSADTQEAKKTIESSLAELKTSLAAHKLSMENVKVDVVNSTSADTSTQNQTNMNGQHQRDQARQFWNQFNENFGSQGRRESFMDMPNLKGYGQRNRDPLQPIETASKARPRSVDGKGSGINLVA